MKPFILTLMTLAGMLSLPPLHAAGDRVEWRQWEPASFERARREDKMLFVDVGIEGCTACRRMAEITLTHPEVIRLLNLHFINISVDAEARPDIGERYSDWAWPALIFMAPDATQVLALRGNRLPENFIPILTNLIEKQQQGKLTEDDMAPYAAPPEPVTTALTELRDDVRGQLDSILNERYGGWSRRMISTGTGPQLKHLYLRAHMYDHGELRSLALKTTDAYRRALDPVWGGVFVKAFHPGEAPERFSRTGYIPEKRIVQQANALHAFAHAYRITGDRKYRQALAEVHRFVKDWMTAENGLFFTSQEDRPPGLAEGMSKMDYWALDSAEKRLRHGVPPIDHATYTDKNSRMIRAYAQAWLATGEKPYLDAALRAAGTLVHERMTEEGWVLQTARTEEVLQDDRMRPFTAMSSPYLSAQAGLGRALLELYQITADTSWLDTARTIADAMMEKLYDTENGGFYATPVSDTATVIPPRKPLELNAAAAHFIYDLATITKDESLAEIPERTLRAVAVPEIVRREGRIVGELALALEKITAAYVEFSVVGDADDPRANALYGAGLSVYEPRKLLHYEKPGRYPERDKPSMYICNPDKCTLPIEEPEKVPQQARHFHGPATSR